MADPKTTFGLTPKSVASLLKLGSEPPDANREEADLLRDRLAGQLPSGDLAAEGLVGRVIRSVSGNTLGDHILAKKPTMAVLRRIKEYGAELSRSAQSEAERHTANIVYYAAIADALIWHHEKISDFSVEDLRKSFSALGELPWLEPSVAELFRQAVQACRDDIDAKSRRSDAQ